MVLNFKSRLYPSGAQAASLQRSIRMVDYWGWNLLVRKEKWARRMQRQGRASNLHKILAAKEELRAFVGRRASTLKRMVKSGDSSEAAAAQIRRKAIHRAWNRKRSGLSVETATAIADSDKFSMVGSQLGSAWAKLSSDKGKFQVAWRACWSGLRGKPRKKKYGDSGSISMQIQGSNPICKYFRNEYLENYVDLSPLMPWGNTDPKVRYIEHRKLPAGAEITELRVVRERSVWWVVFTIDAEVPKEYAYTNRACGIDPGQKTAVTLVGQDGQATAFDPGRPLTKMSRKIAKLQRKLDRQRRANNPDCFQEDGSWIKGKRAGNTSKRMCKTLDRLADAHAHCAAIRRDYWSKAADEILRRYDTVYFGDWQDGTPKSKGKAKQDRKKSKEKVAKGAAARRSGREKVNRDNALGVFRRILAEKASRAVTCKDRNRRKNGERSKKVVAVNERNTTRTCIYCGALTGPTGISGLKVRYWQCSACGRGQDRDVGSAWNILQAGPRQAGGKPVKGRPVIPPVALSIRGGCASGLRIEQRATSSQSGVSPWEPLARWKPPVATGVSPSNKGRGGRKASRPPKPLAARTVRSNKSASCR